MKSWWKLTPLTILSIAGAAALGACNTKTLDDSSSLPPSTGAPLPGPQPTFTTVRSLEHAPPPISGGTLTIAPDGHTAIASDPDRDRIYVVDIPSRTVKFDIKLADDAEPGRIAVDAYNKAYVANRYAGTIATIDLATGNKTEEKVCAAPRGIAYDKATNTLHIACAEGLLISKPLDGKPLRRLALDRDLRDVMISGNKVLVSRLRAADVLVLSDEGGGLTLAGKSNTNGGNIGWRIAAPPKTDDSAPPADEPAMLKQDPVNPVGSGSASVGYYGSGSTDVCSAPTITSARLDIPGHGSILVPPAVLPVDLATNGQEYAIVAAGNGHTPELPQIFIHRVRPGATSTSTSGGFSGTGRLPSRGGTNTECLAMTKGFVPGQAVAAAFDGDDQLIVQSREPAALYIMTPDRQRVWKEIKLSDESREDTGHAIFHSNSGGFLACASCHVEGGDDGRTWTFTEGDRRTPSMRGTMRNTEGPFHWDGSMRDMRHLVDHVFVTRMSGPQMDDTHVDTLKKWLVKIPDPPKVEQPVEAVKRGATIFTQRGCASCHTGANLTNHEVKDVGTGGLFKVPSLVGVAWRAPFIHNGCARTMRERFTACGGDKHGDVAGMTAQEIDDLSTYLESL
jgi:mono/diheme cytochrome c family protein